MILPPHGGQLRLLSRSLGLADPESVLDLSANINPAGPPPSVLAALRAALQDPATLTQYPDLELHDLRRALAAHLGTQPENILVANGFAPLLEATLRALGLSRTLLPVPAFPEYRAALARAGATILPHPLSPETFAYNSAAILEALHAQRADSLLLANPQNPSGVLTPAADLLALFEQIPRSTTILLDEAFIDYAPTQTLTLANLPNLIVFRSVTKFYAIPGLRLAYAAAAPDVAARVRTHLPPWPVSRLAEIATITALADTDYAQTSRTLNRERRESLRTSLGELGIVTPPAGANFLLLRFAAPAADTWHTLLREHGILLRHADNFESLPPNCLRTAIRTEPENLRLLEAIRTLQ